MSSIYEFDKNCKELLKKMNTFDKNFFCKKCNSCECKHLNMQKQKRFKKEIDKNIGLATKVADKVTEIKFQAPCQPLAY